MRFLVPTLLLAILGTSCGSPSKEQEAVAPVEPAPVIGAIDLAIVDPAPAGTQGAIEWKGGHYVLAAPSWHAKLTKLVERTDPHGYWAIQFTIAPSDTKKFADWTDANVSRKMAVCVGEEVIFISTIAAPLFDSGIIFGSYDAAQVQACIAKIKANR